MESRVGTSVHSPVMRGPADNVRLAFVGDVTLAGEFLAAARPASSPLTFPFAPINPLLTECDLLMLNLEGPLGRDGEPRKGVTARMYNEPELLEWLKLFPTCVCNLANNHMLDYGPEALEKTRRLLLAAGIPFVGAGANQADAAEPLFISARDRKLAFLSFTTDALHVGSVLAGPNTAGCASLNDEAAVISTVERVAGAVDTLVVSVHWGHEFYRYPTPDQVKFARCIIDAGATLVIGHHPHVQQGIELYRHGLIAYSLGNLLLPEFRIPGGRLLYRKPYTKQFAILRAEVAGRKVTHWRLEGGRCNRRYQLQRYAGSGERRFQDDMRALSVPLTAAGYEDFWAGYQSARYVELRREALSDALGKLWLADWGQLIRGISLDDVKRNGRRLLGLMGASRR